MTYNWQDIPVGRYAIPRKGDPLPGWEIWVRTDPARSRDGVGRLRFDQLVTAPGGERETLQDAMGPDPVSWLLQDPTRAALARRQAGGLTGQCGVCGKTLWDARSIERGIGPHCWDELYSDGK